MDFIREHSHMTSDVFGAFLTYLLTYPNQMVYYIGLFSKIRSSLTYLPTQKSEVIYECSLNQFQFDEVFLISFCNEIDWIFKEINYKIIMLDKQISNWLAFYFGILISCFFILLYRFKVESLWVIFMYFYFL